MLTAFFKMKNELGKVYLTTFMKPFYMARMRAHYSRLAHNAYYMGSRKLIQMLCIMKFMHYEHRLWLT
jgi:hypothetical protein